MFHVGCVLRNRYDISKVIAILKITTIVPAEVFHRFAIA
jgi:hypothetical protein